MSDDQYLYRSPQIRFNIFYLIKILKVQVFVEIWSIK